MLQTEFMSISCEIDLVCIPQNPKDDESICSGEGLVPLGNKPLPEPM